MTVNQVCHVVSIVHTQVCHVSDASDINEDLIRGVLESKTKGTLEMQSFKQPETTEEEKAEI